MTPLLIIYLQRQGSSQSPKVDRCAVFLYNGGERERIDAFILAVHQAKNTISIYTSFCDCTDNKQDNSKTI